MDQPQLFQITQAASPRREFPFDGGIKAVVLEDLRQSPYRAHVEFDKVFLSPADQQEQRRERWTANVVFGFRDDVPNEMLLTNPLGLVISYCREDQAFEKLR